MVTKKGWICMVFLALLMAGCAQERHAAADVSNFTIALQCGNATPLPLKVVGDIQMDVREFTKSNCSVHGANRVITVMCPRAEFTVPPLVGEAARYLPLTSNQSES